MERAKIKNHAKPPFGGEEDGRAGDAAALRGVGPAPGGPDAIALAPGVSAPLESMCGGVGEEEDKRASEANSREDWNHAKPCVSTPLGRIGCCAGRL